MDRVQKRCLLGSLGLHAFLILVFLFGSAFFPARKPDISSTPTIKLLQIPEVLTDGPSGGGGNPLKPITNEQQKGDPNAHPVKPPTPPAPVAKTPVKPPETKPIKPEVVKHADPPKPVDPLGLKPVVRKTTKTDPEKSTQDAAKQKEEKAAREARDAGERITKQLSKTMNGLSRGFLQGTVVGEIGGTPGVASANYAHFVREIYDDAWAVPSDVSLDSGVATVKITVARDGRIIRATIVDRSGNRVLDLSVQKALDSVTKLPAFPEGSRDDQRTFTIDFNLKAKHAAA
jgi:TonB family protein